MALHEVHPIGLPGKDLVPFGLEDLSGLSPEQFLDFLKTISPQEVIQDRSAQAALDKIMSHHYTRSQDFIDQVSEVKPEIILLKNPNPVIELRSESGNSFSFIHGSFQLNDTKHWYYFTEWWPGEDLPEFLREQDVIPSGRFSRTFPRDVREQVKNILGISDEQFDCFVYNDDPRVTKHEVLVDIPFNKPINRVLKSGGEANLYNHVTGEWEPSGDGTYTPSVKERALELVIRVGRKLGPNQPKKIAE